MVYAFGISGNAARQGHDLVFGFVLRARRAAWLIAAAYSGGAIRIVLFGSSVSFGFCGLMLF